MFGMIDVYKRQHLSVAIPPKLRVSDFMGYLKGKSTLMIYDRHPELQSKWDKAFWARGYLSLIHIYGMFIAVKIDTNTAETFRHGIWYARGDLKQRLDIVPLTLAQYREYFMAMFRTGHANPEKLR